MKLIYYILICCLLGLYSCSKEQGPNREKPTTCPYIQGTKIYSVTQQPITAQEIVIINYSCGDIDMGAYKLTHTADTNTYDIPLGTMECGGCGLYISGAQLGFQIDTISDVVSLRLNNGTIIDSWSN
jgi:hypothetical protein